MKVNTLTRFLIIALTIFSISIGGWAEEKKPLVSKEEQKEVVKNIGDLLNKNYVFPETAEKMSEFLGKNLKKGKYKKLTAPMKFADQLSDDLREVSKDLHIRVVYSPHQVIRMRKMNDSNDTDPEILALHLRRNQRQNFGFKEVKILDGNIGYLDLRGFFDTDHGGETAVAAMNFLANCDTLIIDLRYNGGGSPQMIQLITSYLFDSEPVHLNNFYCRPSDSRTQTWTIPHVPGKRMPKTPVYVLTSKGTFSAAEEFSYNLKNLKRGTLIGETTGGGAHPGGPRVVNDHFFINVPSGRAINPISKTNWEGKGVKPDIEITSAKAFDTAYLKALETLAKETKDKDDQRLYKWVMDGVKADAAKVTIAENTLKSYAGNYGPRTITFEKGNLYYQKQNRTKMKMIP
jgi:retinol-binding protein 3